uniref:Uncharacterized protein n=1 Tax=Plectus sambesii TaxID=2011161 RepID=A0A914VF36_9BILA
MDRAAEPQTCDTSVGSSRSRDRPAKNTTHSLGSGSASHDAWRKGMGETGRDTPHGVVLIKDNSGSTARRWRKRPYNTRGRWPKRRGSTIGDGEQGAICHRTTSICGRSDGAMTATAAAAMVGLGGQSWWSVVMVSPGGGQSWLVAESGRVVEAAAGQPTRNLQRQHWPLNGSMADGA